MKRTFLLTYITTSGKHYNEFKTFKMVLIKMHVFNVLLMNLMNLLIYF